MQCAVFETLIAMVEQERRITPEGQSNDRLDPITSGYVRRLDYGYS